MKNFFSPMDEHNSKLVSNIMPDNWENPQVKECYDLVVIGGGTAGLVTASAAAGLGARTALIETRHLGGDCLNTGCVPSKALIHSAKVVWQRYQNDPSYDRKAAFANVMVSLRKKRADISPHDSAERFQKLGVDVFLGKGSFTNSNTVTVDDTVLHFRKAVIATGARAAELPIPGLAETPHRTNESIFNLEKLPKRLTVIGAGPIGVEMAQSFQRLGSEVHLLDTGAHILGRENSEAAAILQKRLQKEGVTLHLGIKIQKVSSDGDERIVRFSSGEHTEELCANELLVAVGRTPNTEGLGLEKVSVKFDRFGVTVNDKLRTSNRKIFACGDICSAMKFTHTADFQARIVIQNALFFGRKKNSDLVVPWVTFSEPEIAHVGSYAPQLKSEGKEFRVFKMGFDEVDRSMLEEETEGFCEILCTPKGKILGATMVHPHAGDMISEVTTAMVSGLGLGSLAAVIHPYPTQAEIIRKLGDQYNRTRLTAGVMKFLKLLMKIS